MRKIWLVFVMTLFSTYLTGCSILEGTPFASLGDILPDLKILDKVVSVVSGQAKMDEALKNYPKDKKEVVKKALNEYFSGSKKVSKIYFSGEDSFKNFEKVAENLKGKFTVIADSENKNNGWVQVGFIEKSLVIELWRDKVEDDWKITGVSVGDLKDLE